MNKTKRSIVLLRSNLVRRMASQVKRLESDSSWINRWYTENANTPVQAASKILHMKKSKLNKIFYKIKDYNGLDNTYGNLFCNKFPMVVYVCKADIDVAYIHYNSFLDRNNPIKSYGNTVSSVKHYFSKCCKACGNVYFKKEITVEQFDNFSGNDNIAVSFANNSWTGEITSCCEECAEELYKAED